MALTTVTVGGGASGGHLTSILSVPFRTHYAPLAQGLLNIITGEELAGNANVVYDTGTPPPAIGSSDLLVTQNGASSFTVPTGYDAIFNQSTTPITITGGARDLLVVSGADGGLTFAAGSGNDLVVTGGGNNLLIGGSGNDTFITGGNDTVLAGSGNGLIQASGNSLLNLQNSNATVVMNGADTVIAGSGSNAIFSLTDNSPNTVFGGSGNLIFVGGAGASTVTGTTGAATLFGGTGGGNLYGGHSGTNILVINPNATASTVLIGEGGNTQEFNFSSVDNVLNAGPGNATLVGGNATGNNLDILGAGNDIAALGFGADTLQAGTGAATVIAGQGNGVFDFISGQAGGTMLVGNFNPGHDQINLHGYAAGEVSKDLANQQISGGSTLLTLSDGTKITFLNVSGLNSGNFTTN